MLTLTLSHPRHRDVIVAEETFDALMLPLISVVVVFVVVVVIVLVVSIVSELSESAAKSIIALPVTYFFAIKSPPYIQKTSISR